MFPNFLNKFFKKRLANNLDLIKEEYQDISNETVDKEVPLSPEEDLEHYIFLDKYLFCTLEREIKIGLTLDEVGREDKRYILKDYELSYLDKYLRISLERKGDKYPISFPKIKEISFGGCDDNLKTWICMERDMWRFYLYPDKDKLKLLAENFISNKLIKQPKEYEKYRHSEPLKFNLEAHKDRMGSLCITEKLITTKSGNELYLLNTLDQRAEYNCNLSGTIYFIDKSGNAGFLYYELRHTDYERNNSYIKIIDILPNKINDGVGTAALKLLEEYAKEKSINYITGWLSPRDLESHKERLLHFYTVNGFNIKGATIQKEIQI